MNDYVYDTMIDTYYGRRYAARQHVLRIMEEAEAETGFRQSTPSAVFGMDPPSLGETEEADSEEYSDGELELSLVPPFPNGVESVDVDTFCIADNNDDCNSNCSSNDEDGSAWGPPSVDRKHGKSRLDRLGLVDVEEYNDDGDGDESLPLQVQATKGKDESKILPRATGHLLVGFICGIFFAVTIIFMTDEFDPFITRVHNGDSDQPSPVDSTVNGNAQEGSVHHEPVVDPATSFNGNEFIGINETKPFVEKAEGELQVIDQTAEGKDEHEVDTTIAEIIPTPTAKVKDLDLDLVNFCGECMWKNAPFDCDKRVKWEMNKYNITEIEAKKSNLKHCISADVIEYEYENGILATHEQDITNSLEFDEWKEIMHGNLP
eukprot:137421_1